MKKNYFFALILGIVVVACQSEKGETKEAAPEQQTEVLEEDRFGIDVSESLNIGGLQIGEKAPEIIAKTHSGEDFKLSESLAKGPVVLVFYRGHWCGYCTQHLAELEENMQAISAKGAQVFAITPETETYIEKTIEKSKTAIPVIADVQSKIMTDYKVAFQVSKAYQEKIIKYKGEALTTFNGQEQAQLPIPATYVIGQEGTVLYRFYQEDYSKRLEIPELISSLP